MAPLLRIPVALAATVFLAQASAAGLRSDNGQRDSLDRAVAAAAAALFQNQCHVGLSIAVVQANEVRYYDYGATVPAGSDLPTRISIYEIASVTKTFTGALAAMALAAGKMQLDADFRAYLPQGYPNLAWTDAAGKSEPITLRTLATHRSGLQRDLPDTDALFAQHNPLTLPKQLLVLSQGYDRSHYLADLHQVQLRAAPGAAFVYSNLGPEVIGLGLEQVFGAPFEALIRQKITGPLALRDTGFVVPAAARPRLMQPFGPDRGPMPYHPRNAGAAWGVYSTTADLAKYVSWHLDESNPVVRLSHEPVRSDAENGEGLIWNLATVVAERMLWHGGGSFGMTSELVLYPQRHEGYVLLANDACAGTEGALQAAAQSIHRTL